MIIDDKNPQRIRDLLASCQEQAHLIHRIIIEVDPEFRRSKLMAMLENNKWPKAINPNAIVDENSESDMRYRAKTIINWMKIEELRGKKFLDFGCGAGHVAKLVADKADLSAGYDLDSSLWNRYPKHNRAFFSDNFDDIISRGPYDFILLYDVLDHIMNEEPEKVLQRLSDILTDEGKIFVRCHPWCSRSGGHHYRTLNKAWVHLFFDDKTLEKMGHAGMPVRKILHPVMTYDYWFSKANLSKIESSEFIIREPVDPLFLTNEFLGSIIKDHWKNSVEENLANGKVIPHYQIEQHFVDNILVKALGAWSEYS